MVSKWVDNSNLLAINNTSISVFCSLDVPAPVVNDITYEANNCTVNLTVMFIDDVLDGGSTPEIITRYNTPDL